ncbi:hypothetical protein [Haliscomenobacter sp.]|uniref:hypothetical protein n=1 Tax=Haliscomenobacter sp. TaxID=2717303 RepID=UPI003BAAB3D5
MSLFAIKGLILLFLLMTVIFVLAVTFYMMTWTRAALFLRKKGYAQAIGLVLVSWAIGLICLVFPAFFLKNINWLYYSIYVFLVICLLPLVFFAWADKLPKSRLSRASGNRTTKVNWRGVGNWVAILMGLGLVFLLWISGESWKKLGLRLIVGFVVLTILNSLVRGFSWARLREFDLLAQLKSIRNYFHFLHYSYEKPNIELSVSEDLRPPVLFIRSFLVEYAPFYVGNIFKNGVYTEISPNSLILNLGDAAFASLNFQQFFEYATNEKIGKLVGLGNPEDGIPPEGLNVSYYHDENWQEAFKHWGQRSSAIFNVPGDTGGLRLELEHIFQNGLADKFFIFTPPSERKFFRNFMRPLMNWMLMTTAVPWLAFASDMNSIGYQIQYNEPPSGSVIGFEKNGWQRLIVTGASNPFDYIEAVFVSLSKNH